MEIHHLHTPDLRSTWSTNKGSHDVEYIKLYKTLIAFLCTVMWHMSVCSLARGHMIRMSTICMLAAFSAMKHQLFISITLCWFSLPLVLHCHQSEIWIVPRSYRWGPAVGTHILEHGREVLWWWPPFGGFSIQLGPYFIPQHVPIDPLFLQKKSLCLYHI